MNYMPYYNQPYYQDQLSQLRQYPQTQPGNSIIWVQGEAAARAYMVAAGNSVLLMDSDASVFYLKSTDASGMPQPMRIFEYVEKTEKTPQKVSGAMAEEYVTRKEFNALLAKLSLAETGEEKGYGESDIQNTERK